MAATRSEEAAGALQKRIASGDLAPGERLGPSLEAIARDYGVGKTTMHAVLTTLAGEGVVRKVPGIGYFVADLAGDKIARRDADGVLPAWARKLQEDVADLKADVAELQARRGVDRPARKREHGNEQSG